MKSPAIERPQSVESLFHVSGSGVPGSVCANTYVLLGECPVLIEAGSVTGYSRLKRNLGALGLQVSDIKVVLATHGHWDHVSGMELLSQESDAELLVPTEDLPAVESGDDALTVAPFYGHTSSPIKVAGEVHDTFRLDVGSTTIEAIKTPWHTPGSVCYKVTQSESVTLIAADTLYGFYFSTPGRDIDEDIEAGKESLGRLRAERFDYMTMGHAMRGFRGDVATRLEESERQFATFDAKNALETYDGLLEPAFVNPWRKRQNQPYKY